MNSDKSDEGTEEWQVAPVQPEALWAETCSSRVVVDLAAVSDCGLVRENNQDCYLVVRIRRSMEKLLTNLLADQVPAQAEEVGYGFVVADGRGGPTGGVVASQKAISTLVNLALHEPDWVFGISPEDTKHRVQRRAKRWEGVQEAIRARRPGPGPGANGHDDDRGGRPGNASSHRAHWRFAPLSLPPRTTAPADARPYARANDGGPGRIDSGGSRHASKTPFAHAFSQRGG